ncbi:type IVB secretion system protein IcmH/DotU [Pseudomonas sp. PD9R]|uniref:type IVB secretion system protein IcmH/DotU n=1 Tax=Pseudomonas sp. PD9R TaxID=2853534 RepID=UPI001C473566|nr:type IVB secretion system protein IcmH/DotU [Pseudomonas sp. PD9R]MBV6825302.1 type IVB secretion system protein IcmH/DotU [Pseudomonas sp. PD9R]
MIKDMEHYPDDKTVLLDRQGHGPAQGPLTDFAAPPRFEHLDERMIYAAEQKAAQTFSTGLNSLAAAASSLLSQVVQLKHCANSEDLPSLNGRLCTELKNFEGRALHRGVERGQVSTAHYVLCTVIDEAVVTTTWGKESGWSQMSLLSRFHNERSGGERFFQFLDQLSKDPVKNLPILELMYLCLSLGFEGKYRIQPRGHLELESLRDALYRQIRLLRADVPRELSPHWEGLGDQRSSLVRIVPWWMVLLITAMSLVVMYSGFVWTLADQRVAVLQPFERLDQPAVEPPSLRLFRGAQ